MTFLLHRLGTQASPRMREKLPFTFTHLASGTHRDTVQIALYWFQKAPSDRRLQYPSWSPLGWKGSIEFYALLQPVTPIFTTEIEFPLNNKWEALPLIDSKSYVTLQLTQKVPLLRVTALIFELPLTTVWREKHPGSPDDLWVHCANGQSP